MPRVETLEDNQEEYFDAESDYINITPKEMIERDILNENNLISVDDTGNLIRSTYKISCRHVMTLITNVIPFVEQRKIKSTHVNNLKKSIEMNKLLLSPISLLVIKNRTDDCFLIFDGQHRLKALEELINDNPDYVENDTIKGIEVRVYYVMKRVSLTLKELFLSFNLSFSGNSINYSTYKFCFQLAKTIHQKYSNFLSLDTLIVTLIKTNAFEKYIRKTFQVQKLKKSEEEVIYPKKNSILRLFKKIDSYFNSLTPKNFMRIVKLEMNKNNIERLSTIDKHNPKCRLVMDDVEFVWVHKLIEDLASDLSQQ